MNARLFLAITAFVLAACQSTVPTAGDMDKYYREAESQAGRDIARLRTRLSSGDISQEQFDYRSKQISDSVPDRAMKMAWAHHELVQAQMRSAGIPTPDAPVILNAPGPGASDTFYRAAGAQGDGYQGTGAGMWHGYTPGATINSLGTGGLPGAY